jgi:transcriptional regulator with XRE-family HTH domain
MSTTPAHLRDGLSVPAAPRRRRPRKAAKPHPIDVLVGSRLRLRRTKLGISQARLAEALGLTFQQVQKYERGTNRISASRLYRLSKVLDVPIAFFFEPRVPRQEPEIVDSSTQTAGDLFESDPLGRPETIELVKAFWAIDNVAVRHRLFELASVLAAEEKRSHSRRAADPRKRRKR